MPQTDKLGNRHGASRQESGLTRRFEQVQDFEIALHFGQIARTFRAVAIGCAMFLLPYE